MANKYYVQCIFLYKTFESHTAAENVNCQNITSVLPFTENFMVDWNMFRSHIQVIVADQQSSSWQCNAHKWHIQLAYKSCTFLISENILILDNLLIIYIYTYIYVSCIFHFNLTICNMFCKKQKKQKTELSTVNRYLFARNNHSKKSSWHANAF